MKENEESTIILYNMYIKAPNYILSAFRNSKPFLSSSPSLLNYYLSLFSSHFAFLSPSRASSTQQYLKEQKNQHIHAHAYTIMREIQKRKKRRERERKKERE